MKGLTLSTCRRRFATLWFAFAAVLVALVLAQSVLGHYGSDSQSAWNWLLPLITPTLSLMVGVLFADAGRVEDPPSSVDRFAFWLSFGISLSYLFALLAALLLQPLAVPAGKALDFLKAANLWLVTLQGLATGALGAFFIRAKTAKQDSGLRGTAIQEQKAPPSLPA